MLPRGRVTLFACGDEERMYWAFFYLRYTSTHVRHPDQKRNKETLETIGKAINFVQHEK